MDKSSIRRDLRDAAALIERANAQLAPGELGASEARSLMQVYASIERLGSFGVTALSARVEDPERVARIAAARGPTSTSNLQPRCYTCRQVKTARDRRAGLLSPRAGGRTTPAAGGGTEG